MNQDDQIARPWLAQYPRGVPHRIEVAHPSLTALLAEMVPRYPHQPFLNFYGRQTSYREAAELVDRAAAGFRRLGVQRNTSVALCLPNTPASVLSYFAVLQAGGTVVNLNPLAPERQLVWQLADAAAEIAVTVDLLPIHARIVGALDNTKLRHVVVCRMADMLPFPRNLAFRLREHAHLAKVPADERVHDFVTLTRLADQAAGQSERHADIAVIQYTGGTTGEPKGAQLSHGNLCANVAQLRAWFTQAAPGNERLLGVLPFFHCFGMTAVMNFAVALGGELVILPRFRPAETLRVIEQRRITLLVGVPALFQALLNCPAAERTDFSSLKVCVSGGDALPMDLAQRFAALTGAPLAEGYGLTECSPVVTCSNPLEGIERPGSCGLPLPGTDVAIMAPEPPHTVLPANEIGEICVRGPQVMRGYRNQAQATQAVLHDGWLRTGDLGYLDQDGFLLFVNRRPEVIAVRGNKVYARAVEAAIRLHPAVTEVAVIGVPDAVRGAVPKACVVLRGGMSLNGEALRAFLADKLSSMEMPRLFEFRTSLPKSPFGKVLKHQLSGPATDSRAPRSGADAAS